MKYRVSNEIRFYNELIKGGKISNTEIIEQCKEQLKNIESEIRHLNNLIEELKDGKEIYQSYIERLGK